MPRCEAVLCGNAHVLRVGLTPWRATAYCRKTHVYIVSKAAVSTSYCCYYARLCIYVYCLAIPCYWTDEAISAGTCRRLDHHTQPVPCRKGVLNGAQRRQNHREQQRPRAGPQNPHASQGAPMPRLPTTQPTSTRRRSGLPTRNALYIDLTYV